MPCYHPLKAFRSLVKNDNGNYPVVFKGSIATHETVTLPCGQCVGCRLDRSRQWAVRCMHEARCWQRNCFITLTYADQFLPKNGSLVYDDFQKFMKRLRFSFKGHQALPDGTRPIRFYMAGEYGENFGRPHFHACIFNFDFEDKAPWERTTSGELIYRSKALEELWPFGYSSVGEVTFKSAAYVARYIMKKITGRGSAAHYYVDHDEDGVISSRTPEFNKMSLKPGIGAFWFDKYSSDVFPRDSVIINGKAVKPPRYYDKLFDRLLRSGASVFDHYEIDEMMHRRWERAQIFLDENSPERLAAREKVELARLSRLKRKLT